MFARSFPAYVYTLQKTDPLYLSGHVYFFCVLLHLRSEAFMHYSYAEIIYQVPLVCQASARPVRDC